VRVRCPAKINLGLWIRGPRPDGYHDIDTVFQAVTLEDELVLERAGPGLRFRIRGLPIPGPGPNIVERAWDLLAAEAGPLAAGIAATLTKRIPPGGGLGGGSSDAAGFLAGATRLLGLDADPDRLRRLAVRLGADVAFFLEGGTARGTGRGDEVRQMGPIPPCWIVLATPSVAVPTAWAYGEVRKRLTHPGGDASMLAAAIEKGDWTAIVACLHNDFEDVVLPQVSAVGDLRRALSAGGAPESLLSGSGSTVFALTQAHDRALALADAARRRGARVHVVRPHRRGVIVAPPG
jgi:4-diphosphocytidyl-2-C-methyl-D-erythritol kinase